MTEIQEVLDDQLNRLLTREYIIFLGNFKFTTINSCKGKKIRDRNELMKFVKNIKLHHNNILKNINNNIINKF